MQPTDKIKFSGTELKTILQNIHSDFSECCTNQEARLLRKVIEREMQKYPDKNIGLFVT